MLRAEKSLQLPLTVTAALQGSADACQTALNGQVTLIGAALIATYLILGML